MINTHPTNKRSRYAFRPDLTAYEIYISAACARLNQDALYPISKTDFTKMAIEKALQSVLPDVKIKPKRKRYIRLDF